MKQNKMFFFRIVFLSVPDLLSGDSSSTFVRIPGFGFPEPTKTGSDDSQKVDIENIVQMLISNPMFIDMVNFVAEIFCI